MKRLLLIIAMVLFTITPTLAQHHSNGGGQGSHQMHQSAPRAEHQAQPKQEQRDERREIHGGSGPERHERGDLRRHWDGRRFDRDYFGEHFGREHRFYWNSCLWYGPRFYAGSRFFFEGAWFVIGQPVPWFWYDDEIYVEYIDGEYFLVDPLYPGVYIRVNVAFY